MPRTDRPAIRRAVLAELDRGRWTHRGNAIHAGFFASDASVSEVGKVIAAMTYDGVLEARGAWSKTNDDREVRLAPRKEPTP